MADGFEPRFADLVRIFTTTQGTEHFIIGAAVTGFRSFNAALEIGDRFYYCAMHMDRPSEREIGRGTLRADGKIAREPVSGALVDFSPGTKTISLVAAAEWFDGIKATVAGIYTAEVTGAVGRSYVSKFGDRLQPGRDCVFLSGDTGRLCGAWVEHIGGSAAVGGPFRPGAVR